MIMHKSGLRVKERGLFGKVKMDFMGGTVDVLPYAKMAVALLEKDERVSAKALAKTFKERGGKNVLKRDNPFDLDFHRVNALIERMINWLQFVHRLEQAKDPDVVAARPLVRIKVDAAPCERTLAMDGKIMPASDVPLLPYPECPLGRCLISIRTLGKRDIEKLAD